MLKVDEFRDIFLNRCKSTFVENYVAKIGPMKCVIQAYDLEGIGRLSTVEGSAMFGLMRMATVMVTPEKKDAPLISYDRIDALGNDTLIIEMYDTCLESKSFPKLMELKEKYKDLPERNPGENWYDSIKLPESTSKKGKKIKERMDSYSKEYLETFVDIMLNAADADAEAKRAKNREYVEGLINNGGPSTDQFVKALGKEETERLYKSILFDVE